VNLAIESGSEYVQKHIMKKNVNLKKAREVVDYFRSINVNTRCFFILGMPRETKAQMEETIEYGKSLNADWCDFFVAIPLIGSEIYEQFAEMGCIDKNDMDWSGTYVMARSFDTEEISAEEIKELAYRANLECNFIGNLNKRLGEYEKAISLYESVLARYPFHVIALYSAMECHEALGNTEEAGKTRDRILELIRGNPLAADMYEKYSDLMPGISETDPHPQR
jgi:tetratricopeptide (TPR) repeat protein